MKCMNKRSANISASMRWKIYKAKGQDFEDLLPEEKKREMQSRKGFLLEKHERRLDNTLGIVPTCTLFEDESRQKSRARRHRRFRKAAEVVTRFRNSQDEAITDDEQALRKFMNSPEHRSLKRSEHVEGTTTAEVFPDKTAGRSSLQRVSIAERSRYTRRSGAIALEYSRRPAT